MAFISLFIVGILFIVFIIGILFIISGMIFLILYFKKNKKKGLLITSIILLLIGVSMASSLPGFFVLMTTLESIDIDDRIDPEKYPVTNAVERHDNKKLKSLLKKGVNPDEVFEGYPVIFLACNDFDNGVNLEAVKLLIQYNVDLHITSNEHFTLMKNILTSGVCGEGQSELCEVVDLLLNEDYDANETDSKGISLLMYAMTKSRFDDNMTYKIMVSLIKNGADINAVDNKGRTVLMWACETTPDEDNIDVKNMPNIKEKGQFAQYEYHVIKYLIENGIDLKAKDKNGYSAIDYFKQSKENLKLWYQYKDVGQSEKYLNECKKIEQLLK